MAPPKLGPAGLGIADLHPCSPVSLSCIPPSPELGKALSQIPLQLQVEPLMAEYKPSIIKRIYFQKLTFGSTPAQCAHGERDVTCFSFFALGWGPALARQPFHPPAPTGAARRGAPTARVRASAG